MVRALPWLLLVAIASCGESGTIIFDDDLGLPPPAPYTGLPSDVEAHVESLRSQMTLDEKAGQMTMAGWTSLTSTDDIAALRLGALGGAPEDIDAHDWLGITATTRANGAATRMQIPVLFAIDAVHGNGKVRGATIFPHNIGLGCTRDPDLVRQVYAATAAEVSSLGLGMNEAPDVDVGLDLRWGRSYESFGEDPDLVTTMGTAAITGTQPTVMAVAKHAIAAGATRAAASGAASTKATSSCPKPRRGVCTSRPSRRPSRPACRPSWSRTASGRAPACASTGTG